MKTAMQVRVKEITMSLELVNSQMDKVTSIQNWNEYAKLRDYLELDLNRSTILLNLEKEQIKTAYDIGVLQKESGAQYYFDNFNEDI